MADELRKTKHIASASQNTKYHRGAAVSRQRSQYREYTIFDVGTVFDVRLYPEPPKLSLFMHF